MNQPTLDITGLPRRATIDAAARQVLAQFAQDDDAVRHLLADARLAPGASGPARAALQAAALQIHLEAELVNPALRELLRGADAIDRRDAELDVLLDQVASLWPDGGDGARRCAALALLHEDFDRHARRRQGMLAMALAGALPPSLPAQLDQRRHALLQEMALGRGPRFENEAADPVGRPPR